MPIRNRWRIEIGFNWGEKVQSAHLSKYCDARLRTESRLLYRLVQFVLQVDLIGMCIIIPKEVRRVKMRA